MQLENLVVGSFLLTVDFFAYSCVMGSKMLTVGAFVLELLCLQLKPVCLQWEGVSNNHLNGL